MLSQSSNDLIGNVLKVGNGKGQDGGTGTREAHAEESRVSLWRHGFDNLAEAGDERLAVGLVNFVLHGKVNELWVRWRLAQSNGEQGYPLQVEYLKNKHG